MYVHPVTYNVFEEPLAREPWRHTPAGTRVRIDSGRLTGAEGITALSTSPGKVFLSVSLLQRSVAVTLSADTLLTVLAMPVANVPAPTEAMIVKLSGQKKIANVRANSEHVA